jgi:cytochrome P450
MGRLEKYWENPLEMKPERWLDQAKVDAMHPYLFIPFQAGPRICLGMKMAYIEIKLMTTMILQAGITFKKVPGFVAHPQFNITLTSSNGVRLKVENLQ